MSDAETDDTAQDRAIAKKLADATDARIVRNRRKIDAAVGAIIAFDRASFHANRPTKRRAVSFR